MASSDIYIRIGAKLDELQRGIQKGTRQLKRFADFAEQTGTQLTTRLTAPIVGIGAAAVQSFAKFERLENGLKAVAGDAELAAEQLARLEKIAQLPGISLEQAVKGSQQLQTVGFEALQAEQALIQLSKAVTLSGGGAAELEGVVRQITQINSKGRILQEDLGVILENVPSIGIALQDAFGTTNVEAIRGMVGSTGEFTAKVIEAIANSEKFQAVQGGLSNDFDNFGQAVTKALSVLGRDIAETINLSGILQRLSEIIGNITAGFRDLDPTLKKVIIGIGAAAAAAGPLALAVGAATKAVIGLRAATALFGGALKALFISPVGLAVGAIAALAAGAIYAYKNSETFRKIVAKIGENLKTVFAPVLNVIVGLFDGLRGSLGGNSDAFRKFMAVVSGVLTAALELVNVFVEGVKAGVEGFNLLIDGEFAKAGQKFGEALVKTNPITIAVASGKRLGDAYMSAYNEALQDTKIEAPDVAQTVSTPSVDVAALFASAQNIGAGLATGGGGITEALPNREAVENVAQLANNFSLLNTQLSTASERFVTTSDGFVRNTESARALGLEIQNVDTGLSATTERMMERMEPLRAGFVAITESIADLASEGAASFKAFASAAVNAIGKVIEVLVQKAVANIIANSAQILAFLGPAAVPVAAAAGRAAGALFSNIVKNITGLAEGGIIPPGYPNDTFPAMLTSGEAVIPLDRLGDLVGGAGDLRGVIRGDDLYLLMQRAQARQNRIS